MNQSESNTARIVSLLAMLTMIGVGIADYFAPLGVAAFIAYLVPVVLTYFSQRPAMPLWAAAVATVLTVIDFAITPKGAEMGIPRLNRGLAVATLWMVAGIGYPFIRTRLASHRESWLQAGQTRLSETLVGEHLMSELGNHVLSFLSKHTGASASAIFVEEVGTFRRQATYAAPLDSVPEQFKAGEGLLGQVAKEGRMLVVSDLPEGYLSIGSALGKSLPRLLLVVPVRVEGVVNAVLEFGFFQAVDDSTLELFERVNLSIGVAVRSVKYRMRLQDLLEETQQQSEEVQAQSEELRVSNEELEEQSRALRESQSRLELQQTELEQINTQLEEQAQVLEIQKKHLLIAKGDLETQAREVEKASRYKSDFLANMSHELRTPLNSTLILAKLLAENRPGNLTPEQVKFASTIESSGNDLLMLINDVLDLSKIEAGHMEINPSDVRTDALLQRLRDTFEPVAAQKSLPLEISSEPGAPDGIVTDEQRLEQVLKNLLSNALKFTASGRVSLRLGSAPGGCVAFTVADTGIGISSDRQRAIFEPFFQGDGTTSRKYGGTGLGLSISRNLVNLLGGEIRLTSERKKGTCFTVIIPAIYDGPAAPAHDASADALPGDEPVPVGNGAGTTVFARVPDDRGILAGDRRVILTVEDDESFAGIVRDLAHEMDFQCLIASTAEEALALARQHLPSAIVLDVGLPDNSGLVVLERLKGDSRTRHIPVHVVSGSDYTRTAMTLGAVGYMLKPVKREQLTDAFLNLEQRLTQKMRRVLVVEDDAVQMEAMSALLGSRDVQTVCARTAAECLDLLKDNSFDCMVLDLSLPDASGFSLLETLSTGDSYAFPPVIVYTGRELSGGEEQRLRKYSKSIIIKGAKSHERLLDEVSLFLHQVVSDMPPEKQRMLENSGNRDAALEGRRILIAEDDVRNIFALTSLLEGRGVKPVIARNGREALQALERASGNPAEEIDLVLMDIMMPEMNGLTAMREIRMNRAWQKLPIIALTAKAMKSDQEQCIEAGANDFLAKPLDVEKLLSLIRVWMPR